MERVSYVVTIDVDWSPDFCTQWLIAELASLGIIPTVFVTHPSEYLKSIASCVELGIHPDFSRLSFDESARATDDLLAFYGDCEVIGSRSHRNVFGQHIAQYLSSRGLLYDVSTFLWLRPSPHFVDQHGLTRFSYSWEDGIHLDMQEEVDFKVNTLGPTIINLHPVLLWLNAISDIERREVTSRFRHLPSARPNELERLRETGGVFDSIKSCISELVESESDFLTLRQYGDREKIF